jgi:hypothetical protein
LLCTTVRRGLLARARQCSADDEGVALFATVDCVRYRL